MDAILASTELRIKIPERVKIISLTGHAVGSMPETSVAPIEMSAHEIVEKAAEMVIQKLETLPDKKPRLQYLTYAAMLVEREST